MWRTILPEKKNVGVQCVNPVVSLHTRLGYSPFITSNEVLVKLIDSDVSLIAVVNPIVLLEIEEQ